MSSIQIERHQLLATLIELLASLPTLLTFQVDCYVWDYIDVWFGVET